MKKILLATEKPFAAEAVEGIKNVIEGAGHNLALLEKYTDKSQLLDAVKDADEIARMRAAQARLRSDRSLSSEERRDMTIRATQDAARVRELERSVEGVADPFRMLET